MVALSNAGKILLNTQYTYSLFFSFSENSRTKKSPSSFASKVDGTMQYAPGLSLKRFVSSRALMKVLERAVEA